MPKAVSLTADVFDAPQITPAAATPPRGAKAEPKAKVDKVPQQFRFPRNDARAIKIEANKRDMDYSDFMLACYHFCMQNGWSAFDLWVTSRQPQ